MAWPLALLNRCARRVFFSKRALRPALAQIKPLHEGGAAAPVIA
jgi:hypothetical protein